MSFVSDAYQTITAPLRKRKAERVAEFKTLAAQIADGGKQVSVDELEQVLVFAGKSEQDLVQAAELIAKRRKARAAYDLAAKTNIPVENQKIIDIMAKASTARQAAIDKADAEYEAVRVPQFARQQELDRITRDGDAGESFLKQTADPEAIRRLREHNMEMQASVAAVAELKNEIHAQRREAMGQQELAANPHTANDGKYAAARAAEARKKVEELEAKLPAMEAAVSPLLEQRAKLELALLDV
jgi:hypothetical protein